MSPFLARRQYNTPILYIGVQRIACRDIEAAAKWPWKNDSSLGGNFGLHGKTILPPSRRFRNTSSSGASGETKRQSDPKPPRRLANRAAVAIGIFTPVFSPCAHQTGCAVPHPAIRIIDASRPILHELNLLWNYETSLWRVFLVSIGCLPAVIPIGSIACHLQLNARLVLGLRYSQAGG
jgi:hypothetical protein